MTKVDWHPYPDEEPTREGDEYLVTVQFFDDDTGDSYKTVDIWTYYVGYGFDDYETEICKVIAWAEKPEPYKPQEPLDMHPDAITARKYAEGDPETVRALHIFDE